MNRIVHFLKSAYLLPTLGLINFALLIIWHILIKIQEPLEPKPSAEVQEFFKNHSINFSFGIFDGLVAFLGFIGFLVIVGFFLLAIRIIRLQKKQRRFTASVIFFYIFGVIGLILPLIVFISTVKKAMAPPPDFWSSMINTGLNALGGAFIPGPSDYMLWLEKMYEYTLIFLGFIIFLTILMIIYRHFKFAKQVS